MWGEPLKRVSAISAQSSLKAGKESLFLTAIRVLKGSWLSAEESNPIPQAALATNKTIALFPSNLMTSQNKTQDYF